MSITTSSQTTSADTTGAAPTGATLRLVAAPADERARHRSRNAFRDEEHDLQGHALALESHCLRRQAERYAQAIERGSVLPDEQILSVVRAFRAYRPFLFDADRVQNDAARRRLVQAVSAARPRHDDLAVARDASVA